MVNIKPFTIFNVIKQAKMHYKQDINIVVTFLKAAYAIISSTAIILDLFILSCL